jgi:putative NADH-flavin reductase
MMKLAIFGATGRTGRHLVEQALADGHELTAIVRNRNGLDPQESQRLNVLTADIMDPAQVAPAIAGVDAVISAIGPRGRSQGTPTADSAKSIVRAMEDTDRRRLIEISGSMVDDTGDGAFLRYVGKPLARRFLRGAYEDMREAEESIHQSRLEWTIMRPPRLTDGPAAGRYRIAIDRNLPRGFSISRADLAAAVLAVISDPDTVGHHVFVAS